MVKLEGELEEIEKGEDSVAGVLNPYELKQNKIEKKLEQKELNSSVLVQELQLIEQEQEEMQAEELIFRTTSKVIKISMTGTPHGLTGLTG